jgi:hypothetical protein
MSIKKLRPRKEDKSYNLEQPIRWIAKQRAHENRRMSGTFVVVMVLCGLRWHS